MTTKMRSVMRTAIVAVLLCATFALAQAKAPSGTDANSSTARWFRSLLVPGTSSTCCGVSDCREVSFRTFGAQYQAFIDKRTTDDRLGFFRGPDKWIPVPDNVIIRKEKNPTGRAVACWTYYHGYFCFILPSMV